ncbi:MAG: Leukotoxin, partial [Verrucomicrobiales bacterium VVV1]
SESSTDFSASDVTVTGGTLSNFTGSGSYYTATFTPNADSLSNGVISVASGAFSDASGNQNADGSDTNNTLSLGVDTGLPTITVSANKTALKAGDTATISFTLSEASTDFGASDVTATGGTLSNFQGSGTDYTATFTPNAGSTTNSVVSVASSTFSDGAGNFNTDGAEANNSVSMTTDTLLPTIAITSDKTGLKAGEVANITFTLSEAATDFKETDVNVTGGTLSNFAGSGKNYTAVFTPTAGVAANGSISVDTNAFSDAAGNFNKDGSDANNTVSITADTAVPTIAISSDKTALKAGD